jgi:hypothetical protein
VTLDATPGSSSSAPIKLTMKTSQWPYLYSIEWLTRITAAHASNRCREYIAADGAGVRHNRRWFRHGVPTKKKVPTEEGSFKNALASHIFYSRIRRCSCVRNNFVGRSEQDLIHLTMMTLDTSTPRHISTLLSLDLNVSA